MARRRRGELPWRQARRRRLPFNDNWSGLAVYKIQQDDEDSDGVILGEDVVWDDGIPLWKNALDTTVPISPSLEFATVDTDPGYPVDGSRAWDCEQVLCAYSEFERDIRGFGLFANAGSLTNRYFRYADEEYIIAALIHFPEAVSLRCSWLAP